MGTDDDIPMTYNRNTHPEILLERIRELEAALRDISAATVFSADATLQTYTWIKNRTNTALRSASDAIIEQ
jgi:hypothetical protein